jgi:hypothetical protein
MWDGIDEADSEGRIYFPAGAFVVEVECCKSIEASDSHKGIPSFIGEFMVLESSSAALPAGTRGVGWVQNFKPDKALKALAQTTVKQFFAAIMRDPALGGHPASKLGPIAASEANPFEGYRCALHTNVKDLTGGGKFTKHIFSALADESPWLQKAVDGSWARKVA